jgi:Leucine Rich repeat
MAPPMTLTYPRTTEPLRPADPELFRQRTRRREVFRRGVIAAVAVAVAAFLVGAFFLIGQHLLTAWWLERQDGMVLWDIDQTNWRQGGVTSVSFAARNSWIPRLRDGDLNHFRRLHRVVSLNLAENDRITNKGMSELRGLDYLAELNLERLERYRQVQFGRVFIPLTDACLVHLQALPRLENLTLAGNLITDQGMSQIAQMSSLKVLELSATEVSDAGLAHIEGMKNLERVDLGATRVTKEGLAQLRLARPNLTIELEVDPEVEQRVKASRGLD